MLHDAIERVFYKDTMAQMYRGILIIRGENVALVMDPTHVKDGTSEPRERFVNDRSNKCPMARYTLCFQRTR